MLVKDLLNSLNEIAPFILQEEYDNSGLQFGDPDSELNKILLCLDLTQDVVREAKEINANTIISHHPAIFSPLKNIVKSNNPALFEAITNNINLISMHTNFDIAEDGLNDYFLKLLNLKKIKPIIQSKEKIFKLITFVPENYAENVRSALFESGTGHIGNYSECSFNTKGIGTFKPLNEASPFIGKKFIREYVDEVKIEVIVKERDLNKALAKLREAHPYEEPAIDIFETKFEKNYGIGAIAKLEEKAKLKDFVSYIKERADISYVRLIGNEEKLISNVAVCTGACSSVIPYLQNVDLFITGDISYHTALSLSEKGITALDIEHFETEKFFKSALKEKLDKLLKNIEIVPSRKEKSPFSIL